MKISISNDICRLCEGAALDLLMKDGSIEELEKRMKRLKKEVKSHGKEQELLAQMVLQSTWKITGFARYNARTERTLCLMHI